MSSKNPAQRLQNIVDNIDAIAGFTAELDFAAFRADRKTVYAVVRALEIISEASRRLPSELLERHPEIDWVAIAGRQYLPASIRRRRRDHNLAYSGTRVDGAARYSRRGA